MTTLVIADAELIQEAVLLALSVYRMDAGRAHKDGIVRVRSQKELGAAIRNARGVDHLVIFLHSTSDGLILGGQYLDFDALGLLAEGGPSIEEISLEGCIAGSNPKAMLALGRALHARRVHGFNYYHVTQIVKTNIPRGAKQANAALVRYKSYLAPGKDADNVLAVKPGNYSVLAEWFRSSLDETPLPAYSGLKPKDYKSRSDALEVTYRESDGLPAADESPVAFFQRVTVELDKSEVAQDAGHAPAAKTSGARPQPVR
jgi:hypothetical protein